MPIQSTTVRPKTLNEIPEAFREWWAKYHRHLVSKVRFSRPTRSQNLLLMRCPRERHVRVKFEKDALSFELSGKKLYVVLDDFDVETEVDDTFLSCEFKLRHSSHRPLAESLRAVGHTKHPLFVTRAINALRGLEHELPKERIEEASAASTDYLVLFKAMTAPSVATQMAAKDPLAAARLRGAERQQRLLEASGGVLSGEQAAKILGISRQAVDKRRRQGQLIGLTQGKRGYAYPAWQFEGGRTLANLESVLDALRTHDPWMQLNFFVNASDRLNGRSPLEQLRSGELEPILHAAESYGEQGAA
jgi:biotin operon repressor